MEGNDADRKAARAALVAVDHTLVDWVAGGAVLQRHIRCVPMNNLAVGIHFTEIDLHTYIAGETLPKDTRAVTFSIEPTNTSPVSSASTCTIFTSAP